jgi:hypothetical protein
VAPGWPPRSPWGSLRGNRRSAAWAGAASMAAAVVAYYLARKAINPAAFGGYFVRGEAIPYLVIGLIAGAGIAVLGAAWRREELAGEASPLGSSPARSARR